MCAKRCLLPPNIDEGVDLKFGRFRAGQPPSSDIFVDSHFLGSIAIHAAPTAQRLDRQS